MSSLARRRTPLADLGVAMAITGTALCVQSFYYWRAGAFGEPSFAIEHLVVVATVQVVLALSLGGRFHDRAWAIAAFVIPAMGALLYGRLASHIPEAVGVLGVLTASVAGALFLAHRLTEGHPFLLGSLGAILGAEILRFRVDAFRGFATEAGALIEPVLVGLACLFVALLSPRLARPARRPGSGLSLALLAAGVLASSLRDPLGLSAATYRPQVVRPTSAAPPAVVIVLDTVRADHLRLYGYSRDTMPNLERFARAHCVWAERAIATAPASLETHASMFTGLYPPRHGAHKAPENAGGLYLPLRPAFRTLAEFLQDAGYWTVGLSANIGPLDPNFGLAQGFDVYKADPHPLKRRSPWLGLLGRLPIPNGFKSTTLAASLTVLNSVIERRADQMSNEALAVLGQAREPLFLFVNYLDAHIPYLPPRSHLDRYPGRSGAIPLGLPQAVQNVTAVLDMQRALSAKEREHITALYDGEISFLDSQLGRLLDALERHPRFGEMLVVILADHGEALGEHSLLGHLHLYDEVLAIPFIVKPGSVPAPVPTGSIDGLMQSVDVFPLVMSHARIPAPGGSDGVLWGLGRTAAFAWAYPFPEHVRKEHPRFGRLLRSAETEGLKLIEDDAGRTELYDLAEDPDETRDLSQVRPQETTRLRALFEAVAGHAAVAPDHKGPDVSPEVLERLRALGYIK